VRERLHGGRLDHQLARGLHPASSQELQLHARRLTSRAKRASIADALEEILEFASRPPTFSARVPPRRAAVLAARPDIELLAAELRADERCRAGGVALAKLLITDGASPMYGQGPEEELLAAVREAYRALRLGERT
jgi:hypothetical protein